MNLELMKPKKSETILTGENKIYEVKYDGGSALLVKKNGMFQVFHGENPTPVTHRYPELIAESSNLKDGIYVAELCALNAENPGGHFPSYLKRQCENSFKIGLRANLLPITAMVYDVVEFGGKDCSGLSLLMRKQILFDAVMGLGVAPHIQLVPFHDSPDPILANKDLEGIVIKDINSPYLFGKRDNWYKYRFNKEETVKFVSFENWEKKTGEEGIVMITEAGRRVTLAGPRVYEAKDKMEGQGFVMAEIVYNGKTDKGFRFTTVKRIL
jgi:ATP-dependent DNA ligase